MDQSTQSTGGAAPNWLVEYVAPDGTWFGRHLFDQTMRLHHAPQTEGWFQHGGPAIIKYGSDAQKHFTCPNFESDINWCQGYSEPGAGSDLASVSTEPYCKAITRVNGSKIRLRVLSGPDHIFVGENRSRCQEAIRDHLRDGEESAQRR